VFPWRIQDAGKILDGGYRDNFNSMKSGCIEELPAPGRDIQKSGMHIQKLTFRLHHDKFPGRPGCYRWHMSEDPHPAEDL